MVKVCLKIHICPIIRHGGSSNSLALGIRNTVMYGLGLRMGIRLCRAGLGNQRTTLHSQIPKRTDKRKPAILYIVITCQKEST
jgi:hypothetical protein